MKNVALNINQQIIEDCINTYKPTDIQYCSRLLQWIVEDLWPIIVNTPTFISLCESLNKWYPVPILVYEYVVFTESQITYEGTWWFWQLNVYWSNLVNCELSHQYTVWCVKLHPEGCYKITCFYWMFDLVCKVVYKR